MKLDARAIDGEIPYWVSVPTTLSTTIVDCARTVVKLEDRFVELAGGATAVEGMEWLHSYSD